jgi:uncharacterized protein (DUF1501 family)
MREKGAEIDPAIASLLSDLAAGGKRSCTRVLTLSELGRTPQINADGGRDHYPEVFSALLAGGGVAAGMVVGAYDARGRRPRRGQCLRPWAMPRTIGSLMRRVLIKVGQCHIPPSSKHAESC